jgi:hypothetical protein
MEVLMINNNDERMINLSKFFSTVPKDLDMTNEDHFNQSQNIADTIIELYKDTENISILEKELISSDTEIPLMIHLSVKLAKSKSIILSIKPEVNVSIVFAAYKEHIRILPKEENEKGENFLIVKVNQLEWLFKNSPNFNYKITMVDDGCPERTGFIAQNIVEKNKLKDKVSILFLRDAIKGQMPVTKPMNSTDESQIGGSILYGMCTSTRRIRNNHIVIYTDANLSTHLGQLGLLINEIYNNEKLSAVGSRREPESIVIKKGIRNTRTKMFIYLWKRMLHPLNYITDTQCGFKAFKASVAEDIIYNTIEKKFAFDIELMLKTELKEKNSIAKVPVAWIDSDRLSTTKEFQPYFSMLKSIAKMYRKYLPENNEANSFASFIENLEENEWNVLLENLPEEIVNKEPLEFDSYNEIKVEDLEKIISN